MIFDNVSDSAIWEDYWPVAQRGAILITTRQHALVSQPIDDGLEITEFDRDEGARLLLHFLGDRQLNNEDYGSALDVSMRLGGHALAINQMAALIRARKISIPEFLILYDIQPKRAHRERKPGWKYIAYQHALDTVWELSFQSLSPSAARLLGIIAFLAPDSVHQSIFELSDEAQLPSTIRFCADAYE